MVNDTILPGEKWEFDKSVADCFENMLERSIPGYETMRELTANIIYCVIKHILHNTEQDTDDFDILDLGCSDGLMLERLMDRFNGEGFYTGVDVSEPMLSKAKRRFENEIRRGQVNIYTCDLKESFPYGNFEAITSILTAQFVPIEYRQHLIQEIYDRLISGGCFVMVEKVLGNTDKINQLFVNNYYDIKRKNGYTDEQINRKRLSLEGVLVPVTNDWNIELLKQAGFKQVDIFWKHLNFVGYIAIK